MQKQDKIFIAGASGMVGSALIRALIKNGYTDIIGSYHSRRPDSSLLLPEGFDLSSSISDELRIKPHDSRQSRLTPYALRLTKIDLTDQAAVQNFHNEHRPDHVFLAAAKVGGIHANNTYPAEFIYQNLIMEANVIHASHLAGVKQLLFLGSSCIYPKFAEQPMREDSLLTGTLEPTNEPYAIAKIAGIKLCESYNRQHSTDYRSVMPTNLYGSGDNFHHKDSHVIPALMRRIHEAKKQEDKTVTVWGSGKPKREFLHVDDLADACMFIMNMPREDYSQATEPMLSHVNVGTGTDISIASLAQMIAEVVGFEGEIVYDTSMPDGTPRKLLDVSKLVGMGWKPEITLEEGLKQTYAWFQENISEARS
jgi:nucleoside-diphosphate-sugar epimerase